MKNYGNDNLAYDLRLFDDSRREESAPAKSPAPKRGKASVKKERLSVSFVLGLVICACAIISILYSYVELGERGNSISKIKNQITTAKEAEVRLMMEIDKKNDMYGIRDYAINRLGMVPVRDYQIEYVRVAGSDKAEIIKNEDPFSAGKILKNALRSFNIVLEYLK